MDSPAKNTDRELWRERDGDYYANSIHVTAGGGIGINVGGYVIVKPLSAWHESARARDELVAALRDIAKQEPSYDKSVDEQLDADFEGAYDKMIEVARAALSKATAPADPTEGPGFSASSTKRSE